MKYILFIIITIIFVLIAPGATLTTNSSYSNNTFNYDGSHLSIDEKIIPTSDTDKALELYKEFLEGKRKVLGVDMDFISIPTGEPDSRYYTKYTFFDTSGTGIPDLHVKSARYYYIFTYKDGDLVTKSLLTPQDELLNNGAFLRIYDRLSIHYSYFILDPDGEICWIFGFGKTYINKSKAYDEADFYSVGTPNSDSIEVTKEFYEGITEPFLSIGSDEIEWVVLFETRR